MCVCVCVCVCVCLTVSDQMNHSCGGGAEGGLASTVCPYPTGEGVLGCSVGMFWKSSSAEWQGVMPYIDICFSSTASGAELDLQKLLRQVG